MIGEFFDWLLDWIFTFAESVLNLLPDSPFQELGLTETFQEFSKIMSWINYFVPLGTMSAIMTTYISAVLLWYASRWVLRLSRYIQ